MQTVSPESSDKAWFPQSRAEHLEVAAQLELILGSVHFRQSKRSSMLLRYIVDKTLKGQEGILKERILGVEVFGRAADYDTSAVPIVRMAAGEVRKRIAQYYHDSSHLNELRIDLQPGSYVAQFRMPRRDDEQQYVPSHDSEYEPTEDVEEPVKEEVFAESSRRKPNLARHYVAVVSICLVVLISLSWLAIFRNRSGLQRLWGTVLEGNSPRVVCLGAPGLYLSAKTTDNQQPLTAAGHIRTTDSVTYSEVQALVRLLRFLEKDKASYTVQLASSTTFADLRQGPAVLLGGLDNPWTMRAQHRLRFQLAADNNGLAWILDSRDPGARKWSVDFNETYSTLTSDYAIVARFLDPDTQEPTLIVAGLGENSLKAAAEFVTDDKQLRGLIGDELPRLGGKNFEVVLGTQVINGVSGPPRLLAKEIW